MIPLPSQAAPRPSERVRLARMALAAALATPGVAGGCPGPGGQRVTADAPGPLTGISAIAEPDGRYELALCLDAELVPLTALADRVRDRIHAAAREAGLAGLLGSIHVEYADVVAP
jgi:hypothetical protein